MNWLYRFLSARNDARAIRKAAQANSATPILKRAGRKYAGRAAGRAINRLFR